MTRGVMILLFACMLIVSARVSSIEADLEVAMHPSVMAPAYAPEKPHPHAPEKAPVYPPTKPVEPVVPTRCADLCLEYCRPISAPRKKCQRLCSQCCAKCDCVPEKGVTCKYWDTIMYHGVPVKCP